MRHTISTINKLKTDSWHEMEIVLPYTPPLDWKSLLEYFNNHEIGGTEKTSNHSYERVFEINGVHGFLLITHHVKDPALDLKLWVQDKAVAPLVVERVRWMFDLDVDHAQMLSHLNEHPIFQEMIKSYPALRVAKGWDAFETIVLTILGQVVSVKRAKHLMNEFVETHGTSMKHFLTQEVFYLFPTPTQLAVADLAHLGTTQARKHSLKNIASLLLDQTIDLQKDDIEALKEKLFAVPGIGKWSVEYIALRGFGHTDAFPDTDLVLKRVIDYYSEFNIDAVQPWRSYAAIYLWKAYTQQPEKYKGARR